MKGDAACAWRNCIYCDCGESRWFAQDQSEDDHPLAVLLGTKTSLDECPGASTSATRKRHCRG